jgi:hypothetical protein
MTPAAESPREIFFTLPDRFPKKDGDKVLSGEEA